MQQNSLSKTVPLILLTGFLGAGKTTLLNRLLRAEHGLRVAVLVNDFGAVNIDSQLVEATSVDGDMVSLSNGCICCTIRGDLLQAVEQLFTGQTPPPQVIVIETSGVSDPLEVALTFRDVPQMQALVHIDSIITLIDAEQFRTAEREYAVLAMNQIGMADIVVLNKVDLVSTAQLATLEQTIQHIMPNVRVYRTTYADVPLPLLLGLGTYDPQRLNSRAPLDVHVHASDAHHHDHDHPDHSTLFETWRWQHPEPLSAQALEAAIKRLPQGIYRMKGFVYLQDEPQARMLLQVVGTRATLSREGEWQTPPQTELVAIGSAGSIDPDALNVLLERCLASRSRGVLARLSDGVRSWLRGT